jgi:hypothetical protein
MLERRNILALPSAEPAGREETAPAALTPLAVRGLTFEVGAARLIDGIDLTPAGVQSCQLRRRARRGRLDQTPCTLCHVLQDF